MFTVKRPRMEFKAGETYRVYHIGKVVEDEKDKLKYIFYSKGGNVEQVFENSQLAEAVICKMAGLDPKSL